MAVGRATLRCGLIWFWMGLGIVRAVSVLGHVRSFGRVFIGQLVSGTANSGLAMGQAGPVLVFFSFGSSGFIMAAGFGDVALWTFFLQWMVTGVFQDGSILILVW